MTEEYKKRLETAANYAIEAEIKEKMDAEKDCEEYFKLIETLIMHYSFIDDEFTNLKDEKFKKILGDYENLKAEVECHQGLETGVITIAFPEPPEFGKLNFIQNHSFKKHYVKDYLVENGIYVSEADEDNIYVIEFNMKPVFEVYEEYNSKETKGLKKEKH